MNKLYSYASSSSGNCYLYQLNGNNILIDIGISNKALVNKLSETQMVASNIDAIFITHEHIDHIKGLEVFIKNNQEIPVYMTKGTSLKCSFEIKNLKIIRADELIDINDLRFEVISTSHDANEPICLIINVLNKKIAHITDTGYVSLKKAEMFKGINYFLIESNYDEELLMINPNYPMKTKQRIMDDKGHLSNKQCQEFLGSVVDESCELIIYGHLSEQNNNEEKILNHLVLSEKNSIILKKEETIEVCFDR